MTKSESVVSPAIVKAAFGAVNRARLIDIYFSQRLQPTPFTAWQDVYRLLLWPDLTTGLAHCYESDKCQPGKHWYSRSLAFHDWLSNAFGVTPGGLAGEIDWLFRRATSDLAAEVLHRKERVAASASRQRLPYANRGFPTPGDDPELGAIVRESLAGYMSAEPPSPIWQSLAQRLRQYLSLENKRRNLVGEGFEDVLAASIRRIVPGTLEVNTRRLLHDIPGFNRARRGDKPNKVDLSILRAGEGMRTLVTAKWSLRADREKQFASEYSEYVTSESERKPFEYVFVTNEFDPARLMRACEALHGNAPMFTRVVHISTAGLLATYGAEPESSMKRVAQHVANGRLISLEAWLNALKQG